MYDSIFVGFAGLAQSSWTLIKHNIFQHRRNKILTADEASIDSGITLCFCPSIFY